MRGDEAGLARAELLLEEARRILGENPLLLATLGEVHFWRVNLGFRPSLAEAEACARRARELDPDLPQGHVLAGVIAMLRGSQREAIGDLKRALAVAPHDPDALYWLIVACALVGRVPLALGFGERLVKVDPLTANNYVPIGGAHLLGGDFARASAMCRKALEMAPGDHLGQAFCAMTLLLEGRKDLAFELIDRFDTKGPSTVYHALARMWRHGLEGERDKALACLTPQVVGTARRDLELSWRVADAYALMKDPGPALDWLENAVDRGFLNYPYLADHDPFLASIRGEPRFKALMERVRREWEAFDA